MMRHRTSCWLVLLLLDLSFSTVRAQGPFDVPTLPALPVIVDSVPATNPHMMQPSPLYPIPMPSNPIAPGMPHTITMPTPAPSVPIQAIPYPVNQVPVYEQPQLPALPPAMPYAAPAATASPFPVLATPNTTPANQAYPSYPVPSAESNPQTLPENTARTKPGYPYMNQVMRMVLAPVRGGKTESHAQQAPLEDHVDLSPQGLMSPAEIAAARIKSDEINVTKRRAAVRYLGRIDIQFNPEVEEGLLAALRTDRAEIVRFEAALALSSGCCSTKRIVEALHIASTGGTKDGHPAETSERVKWAALEALHRNTQPGRAEPAPTQELPPPTPLTPTGVRQTSHVAMYQRSPVSQLIASPTAAGSNVASSTNKQTEGLLPLLQGLRGPAVRVTPPATPAAPIVTMPAVATPPAAPRTPVPASALPVLTPIGPIPPQYYP